MGSISNAMDRPPLADQTEISNSEISIASAHNIDFLLDWLAKVGQDNRILSSGEAQNHPNITITGYISQYFEQGYDKDMR
jgi:hypothetical protein